MNNISPGNSGTIVLYFVIHIYLICKSFSFTTVKKKEIIYTDFKICNPHLKPDKIQGISVPTYLSHTLRYTTIFRYCLHFFLLNVTLDTLNHCRWKVYEIISRSIVYLQVFNSNVIFNRSVISEDDNTHSTWCLSKHIYQFRYLLRIKAREFTYKTGKSICYRSSSQVQSSLLGSDRRLWSQNFRDCKHPGQIRESTVW